MDKDMKKLIKEAEAQGFAVRFSRRGHPMFMKGNQVVATGSGTSSDQRAIKNLIGQLRKAGFNWPPRK